MKDIIRVLQDGADFYVEHDDPSENPEHIWTAPFIVRDGCFEHAVAARSAFKIWCGENDYLPVF